MNKNGKDMEVATSIATTEPETAGDTTVSETGSGTKQSTVVDKPGGAVAADESVAEEMPRNRDADGRRISISVRALVVGAVIVGLIAAVGTMTWLYLGLNTRFDDQARQIANNKHAEQIALDYAVNAAIMDYKDLGPWKQNLVKGTTPELTDKLTKAGDAMEQILLPLQWSSGAHPLAAKVRSSDNGIYVVDAFVSVMTKTVQAADSLQSTATYSITVDSSNAWKITDVGGIAAVVGSK
jgi:Mce-associated membrane protein